MNAAQWSRLKDLFGEAMEADEGGRAVILTATDAESAELGAELRSLLEQHDAVVLQTSAIQREPGMPTENPIRDLAGPYRLLRELGRGGSGVVFLAERADDEFHRPVALKLLRYANWDRHTERALLQERQALSQLRHPGIASLVDWGVTADEIPWLAVEYVEGEPIDLYCRSRELGVDAILEMFLQVCDAIRYAHQRLIVHRDLKPANILVTAEGKVKLLDFGIARLLEQQTATATMDRRFTPAYASPEQIEGGQITAATDVYSLGLLLWELLTGRQVYAGDTLNSVMRKVLDGLSERASDTPGLSSDRRNALRGDLDRILRHCLEKNPDQRYSSVEQLAADIVRYRDGYPISVQPPGLAYRASRFVRRNRVGVAASAIVILAVLGGAGVAIWEASAARREQRAAERRFQDLKTLAHSVIYELHDAINRVPGSVAARRALVTTAMKYLDGLRADGGNDDSMLMEMAGGYYRMGYVQGGVVGMNLGDAVGGRRSFQIALDILNGLWKRHPDDAEIGSLRFAVAFNTALSKNDPVEGTTMAETSSKEADTWAVQRPIAAAFHSAGLLHQTLGRVYRSAGRLDESLAHFDRAMEQFAELNKIASKTPLYDMGGAGVSLDQGIHMLGVTQISRGQTLIDRGDYAKAVEALRYAQDREREVLAMDNDSPAAKRQMAVSNGHLSVALLKMGNIAEALKAAKDEMTASDALMARDASNIAFRRDQTQAWRHVGNALCASGKCAEALPYLERSAEGIAKIAAADLTFLFNRLLQAAVLNDEGEILMRLRRVPEAHAVFARARETSDRALVQAPGWVEFNKERSRAAGQSPP